MAMKRQTIKRLMKTSKLTTEQAIEAVNNNDITSDEMFNYFEFGVVIKETIKKG